MRWSTAKRRPLTVRFWEKVKITTGCWTWLGTTRGNGYGAFCINRIMYSAHRIAWEIVNGPIPKHKEVLHNCDNPACVKPAHLSLGTHRKNMKEAAQRSRIAFGIRVNTAKLSEADVLELRARYTGQRGEQKQLASEFGVHPSVLNRLFHGKTWKRLR